MDNTFILWNQCVPHGVGTNWESHPFASANASMAVIRILEKGDCSKTGKATRLGHEMGTGAFNCGLQIAN